MVYIKSIKYEPHNLRAECTNMAKEFTTAVFLCRYAVSPFLPQDHLTALMEVNEENQTLTKQFQREKQRRKELEDVSVCVCVWGGGRGCELEDVSVCVCGGECVQCLGVN